MDTQLFLKINNLAKATSFAHGFLREYAIFIGLALLGLTLAVAAVMSFVAERSDAADRDLAIVCWTGIGALIAFGINQPVSHLIGRARPFVVLKGVEVLIPRASDPGFPSDHATIAGAVIAGLWCSRHRLLAGAATAFGVFLAFDRVYVGAHYPSDVLAGLGLGAVVVLVGVVTLARPIASFIGRFRTEPVPRFAIPIPPRALAVVEMEPNTAAPSGSVRLLTDRPITPLRSRVLSGGVELKNVRSS